MEKERDLERLGDQMSRASVVQSELRCLFLFRPIFFFKKKDVIFTPFLLPIFFRKKVFSARVDVGYL